MQFKTADECRAAIRAGNYRAADRLLAELRSQVEEAWPSAGPDQRQLIAGETLELLTWARQTMLAKRAHTYKRLREISRHTAYLPGRMLGQACVDFES
jgi:hypothetical protein